MFLIVMVIGLVGLAVMAFPALIPHGSAGHLPPHGGSGHLGPHALPHGHAAGTGGPQGRLHSLPAAAQKGGSTELVPADSASRGRHLIPSPRGVFTAFALFGAFGYAAVDLFHVSTLLASLVAIVPTVLVERLLVKPLWNLIFRFHAHPEAPLDALILCEAVAVVPFRNGRGIVKITRDGRVIQLSAKLIAEQLTAVVKVGDKLRIEQVDAAHERVTVSLIEAP